MAALTLNSTIRLSTLALGAALVLAAPGFAGDVSVQLDSGAGFSVKNTSGTIERLRVDEATGNVSRNGTLFVHTTGIDNLFIGPNAGNAGATGRGNSAVGYAALHPDTTGDFNSAVGYVALHSNTAGYVNSAFGAYALSYNTTGSWNSAFGGAALFYNTTGRANSAFGPDALRHNTTGFANVAIGYFAGYYQTTGHDNIYLVNYGVAGESNTIRIGAPSPTHTRAFIAGIRGVTTANADAIPVLIDSSGQLGTVSSSRSVKKDIRDMGDATAKLLDLRPVTFRYNQEQTLPGGREVPPEYGLIAEEVAEVFPDLVVYDEAGKPFTVKYHELAPMLLNEMKKDHQVIAEQQRANAEHQQKIEHQAARIEAQRREYEQQIAALATRLARLEAKGVGPPH
jgi:hypothetical protein